MAAIYERYTKEMLAQFDYRAAWLPNTHLELGDVGILRRDGFERRTSLAELDIPFTTRECDHSIDLDYCSADNVSISVNGAAGSPVAPLRITVSFTHEHSVVFQAKACRATEIANRHTLGRSVLALAESGRWPQGHVVITELLSTGPAVVLISNNRDARIELAAPVPTPVVDALPLASAASASLEIVSLRGIGVKIVAPDGLTPLFRASGVQRRLFGEDRFGHRGKDNSNGDLPSTARADAPIEFIELTYQDIA